MILASCVNMSKQKEVLSPWEGFFFKDLSKRISFCFSFPMTGLAVKLGLVWRWPMLFTVVSCQVFDRTVTSTVYQTCVLVPIDWEVADCVTKANFFSSESLREATVAVSSSIARETTLQDLPLSLSLRDSHCLSLTIWWYLGEPRWSLQIWSSLEWGL